MLANRDTFEMHPSNVHRVDQDNFDARLVNILYRDFLSVSDRITLKEKWDRDFPRMTTVNRLSRLLGLFGMVLMTTIMTVYICYFAYRRDEAVQVICSLILCFVDPPATRAIIFFVLEPLVTFRSNHLLDRFFG